MEHDQMDEFRLGLIGASIGRSQAPWLHKKAGQLCGLQIHYKLFDLNELSDKDLKTLLDRLIAQGFHGVNITHPVKEQVTRFVDIPGKAKLMLGNRRVSMHLCQNDKYSELMVPKRTVQTGHS